MGANMTKVYKMNMELPRTVSGNHVHLSAFVNVTRMWAFWFGYFYASHKIGYLESYIEEENLKKAKQLREAEVDPAVLRGLTYFAPEIYDPKFTELQMSLRDRYPDYYLSPSDEFVYQTTRGRISETEVKEQLHTEAVQFLKQWQQAES